MEIQIGKNRPARRSYGFDEVALVPGSLTINPEEVDISCQIGNLKLDIPILASAMDAAVDVKVAVELSQLGGIGVLNLEGLQTRYEDPEEPLREIIEAKEKAIETIQRLYSKPIEEPLIEKRIREIKSQNAKAAVACTPTNAEKFAPIALEAGVDVFVVQSTVTTARHISSQYQSLNFKEFRRKMPVPLIVGNCVSFEAALELMATGIDALLVGVGPGAACTTRKVLGLGVPQATAICDVAAARDLYYQQTKKYVSVIADGGMKVGGDIAKAIACGADAVMIGSPIAAAAEAPGKGYNWGMSTAHPGLPRGTKIYLGTLGTLKEILFGPAKREDGTLNLIGALKLSMSCCGAKNIKEMQNTPLVIASSALAEGKR